MSNENQSPLQSFSAAVAAIKASRHVAVLTGAGMSAESGIPTFRDALTGLWGRFDAQTLATPDAFLRDPELVWGWYEWRRMQVLEAEPNPGHRALAELAKLADRVMVVTQNVDDLHERAGSPDVVHLHGSLHAPRCFACARPHQLPPGPPNEPAGGRRLRPPTCGHCGGRVRPGVVWFGESLSADAWARAESAIRECDVLLVIGTSGLVYPAAGLPSLALQRQKPVIVINPDASASGDAMQLNLLGRAGETLPALLAALRS
jgi:NAD-dependent deacetylase